MSKLVVKFKKLVEGAVIPKVSEQGDVGMDLWATEIDYSDKRFIEVKFGIAVEIPYGHFGLLVPRSSITKMNLMLKNSVGIIDAGYRGELVARFKRVKFDDGTENEVYKIGERAAQLLILPFPQIEVEEVNELESSSRGTGGFGSTGK